MGRRGSPTGRRPTATSGATTRPGQPLLLAGLVKLFGPSLLAWRIAAAGRSTWRSRCSPTRSCAGGAAEGWALAGWLAAAGAMAFAAGPGPNADRAGARAGGDRCSRARRALGAGALCGRRGFFRPEIGVACALGAVARRRGRRARAVARRGARRGGGGPAAPFLGRLRRRHAAPDGRLPRRPAPAAPAVPARATRRVRPEQAARVLDAADPAWRGVRGVGSRSRRRALGARAARALVGLGYLLGRAPTSSTRAAVGRAGGRCCAARPRARPAGRARRCSPSLLGADRRARARAPRRADRCTRPRWRRCRAACADGVRTDAARCCRAARAVPLVRSRCAAGRADLRRQAALRPGPRRRPAALRARSSARTRRATTSCSPAS